MSPNTLDLKASLQPFLATYDPSHLQYYAVDAYGAAPLPPAAASLPPDAAPLPPGAASLPSTNTPPAALAATAATPLAYHLRRRT